MIPVPRLAERAPAPLAAPAAVSSCMSEDLDELARAVRATQLKKRFTPAEQVRHADALLAFATALQHEQFFEDGAGASAEAMEHFRLRVEAGDEELSPRLAASLHVHANCLHGLGVPRSIDVFQSAARLFGALARQDPQRYLPELAGLSNDLGCALREQGRPSEALFHAEKAVEMFDLVVQGDGSELHHLAGAHLNLAKVQSMLGHHEHAVASAREGLRMFEALAEALPHHFASVHVQAMDDLSVALAEAGQFEEALALGQQAAQRVGELARENPTAFVPLVARIANNLGRRYVQAGRLEDALPWGRQAVQGYSLLLRQNPAFLEQAIRVRHNLAQNLDALGRVAEAHAVNGETLELARELGGLPLVVTLREQGRLAHALARHDEALELAIAALQILEPEWRADPEQFGDFARRMAAEIIEYSESTDADLAADVVELLEELAGEA